mgnify:CR=1 FL=1
MGIGRNSYPVAKGVMFRSGDYVLSVTWVIGRKCPIVKIKSLKGGR